MLIVNADDWGRDSQTTDRIRDCIECGTVSSASAMVFMEDSQRAAEIARASKIQAGLHLNLTTRFTDRSCPPDVLRHSERVSRFLGSHRHAQVIFHPGLITSFEYVVKAQLDEFESLYGTYPNRVDGHHHMHLCANVLLQELLPKGTMARRNFSFRPGQKSIVNRVYRQLVDARLARRHVLTDYFFSLPPLEPKERLKYIFSLAHDAVVEVETHPVIPEEYTFLTTGAVSNYLGALTVARGNDVLGACRGQTAS